MVTYSPYDNVKAQNYPNMLIEISLNDSQVPYWEGAKWAAKLREMKTDNNIDPAQDQHGRRTRRLVGPLRPAERGRVRIRVRFVAGRHYEISAGTRLPDAGVLARVPTRQPLVLRHFGVDFV